MFNLFDTDKSRYKQIINNHTQSEITNRVSVFNPQQYPYEFDDLSYESYSDRWKIIVAAYYNDTKLPERSTLSTSHYGSLMYSIQESDMTDEGKELMVLVSKMARLVTHSLSQEDEYKFSGMHNRIFSPATETGYIKLDKGIKCKVSIIRLVEMMTWWDLHDENKSKVIQNVLLQYVNSIIALSSAVDDSYDDYIKSTFNGQVPLALSAEYYGDKHTHWPECNMDYDEAHDRYLNLYQHVSPEIARFFDYYYTTQISDNKITDSIKFNADLMYVEAYYKLMGISSTTDVDTDSLLALTQRVIYFLIDFITQVENDLYYFGQELSRSNRSQLVIEDLDSIMRREATNRLTLKQLVQNNRKRINDLPH